MFPQWYLDCCPSYGYRVMPMPGFIPSSMNQSMPGPMPSTMPMGQTPPQVKPPVKQPPAGFQSNFEVAPGAPTGLGVEYTQGYLKTQIGKRVKVVFLLGTNTIEDRDGILVDVGISYIILRDLEAKYLILADIYSIKFVNIYE